MLQPIISFLKPSEAFIYYEDLHQFVKVETRSGGVVGYSAQSLVWEVAVDAWREEENLEDQYLKLRRIWVDDVHGNVSIYVQLLHDYREQPKLAVEQICELFHDGMGWYRGQGVHVEAIVSTYNRGDDRFAAISDEYYDRSLFKT